MLLTLQYNLIPRKPPIMHSFGQLVKGPFADNPLETPLLIFSRSRKLAQLLFARGVDQVATGVEL